MVGHTVLLPSLLQDCSPQDVPTKLPDIVGQSVLLALCVLLLVFAYNEKIFKEKPQLLYLFSAAVAIGIEVMNHFLSESEIRKNFQ